MIYINELSKKVLELEKEYFDLIYEMFSELILIYSKNDISIDEAVKEFLVKQQHTTIFIPGYKDNHSFKRRQMYKRNREFWDKNKETFIEFIIKKGNVGIFGIGDNTFTSEYMNEVKRNSLFYDVLVFNDPFYTLELSDEELDCYTNDFLFYSNILYIWEIKRYLSVEENEVFAIIFPFDSLLTHEDITTIMDESHDAAVSWINQIFDITGNNDGIVSDIEKIKNLPIEKIQEELYRNGIYQNYIEALNFGLQRLTEDNRKEIEKFCFEAWGCFNREFVRCILTLDALPAMATLNYYTYKLHSVLTMRLKSNPIMSRNEWAPLQRELKKQSLRVSGDYMYTCAIHRNDQMAALMELDYDEIVRYHNKKQCTDFRDLFYRATNEIVNTHVNFDEIANEVFSKIDDLLINEYNTAFLNKKKTRKNAIIGFIKGAIGYVPVLSYAISALDMATSTKDFVQTLSNKDSLIGHFNKRRSMDE